MALASTETTQTAVLIVAAGSGVRFGADRPKQYLTCAGQTVLYHSLSRFLNHPGIDLVQVVIHPDFRNHYDCALADLKDHDKLLDVVYGGETRQVSVRLGLEALTDVAPERVLIHDAARACISNGLIDSILDSLDQHDGVLPCLPVTDTLKRCTDNKVQDTVSRAGLFRAQTPQAFRYELIRAAHENAAAGPELTDDVAVAEAAGHCVQAIPGEESNIKITLPEDLKRAEQTLLGFNNTQAERQDKMTRIAVTGSGYDVHSFSEGSSITICGVNINHTHSLSGHSDADVALHALTDAILGGIAAGDIGQHFPPEDPQWKGADSRQFLIHAVNLALQRGARVVHVDLTIICEAPKLGPHRDSMRSVLAKLLDLPMDQISIKATTTEKLGFTGRREGIAVMANATLLRQIAD